MEENQENYEENLLNSGVRYEIEGATYWAKVCAIVGFITLGISLVESILQQRQINQMPNRMMQQMFNSSMASGLWVTAIFTLISLAISVSLLIFGITAARGIENADNDDVNQSFKWLHRHFMLQGIVIILSIVFVVVVVIYSLNHSFI
ncbi:MAG: hypothetical protein RL757_184 [Bacteroidota bacterium]|jgi:flagellar biosynthesis protein FlhB